MESKPKKQNKVLGYATTSGMIFLYNLLFSLFGMVFLVDAIPKAVTVVFGFIFMIPPILLTFMLGRNAGEKAYRTKSKKNSAEGKTFVAVDINYAESALYVLFFAVPVFILLIIAVAIKNSVVHGIVYIVLMPASLVFATLGVVTTNPVTALSVAVYLPYLLIICGIFCTGYIIKVVNLKNQQRSIENELRMFNN